MQPSLALEHLSDTELIAQVHKLAQSERRAIAKLVAALGEMDARRLYLGQGCSSMFTYCTQVLHLAEHAAFNRIEAARVARRFPTILDMLADGRIHLSAIRLLAPHLNEANHEALLKEATLKSKREVEHIMVRLAPRPDVPSSIRKVAATPVQATPVPPLIPESAGAESAQRPVESPAPVQRPKSEPLAPGRYRLQFTVGEETYQKLRRAQDLLRHSVRTRDPGQIFDRALTVLLAELEKTKLAVTREPRASSSPAKRSRHVPATVRRAVWARDGGRCRFEGPAGRCTETGLLEFHHVIPYGRGGPTTIENLELRCAAHNRYEAEQWFGLSVREPRSLYLTNFSCCCAQPPNAGHSAQVSSLGQLYLLSRRALARKDQCTEQDHD